MQVKEDLLLAIQRERDALEEKLRKIISESLQSIPKELRVKPLKLFLQPPPQSEGKRKRKTTMQTASSKPVRLESAIVDRRVTRSMASQQEGEEPTKRQKVSLVPPNTPKFHPGLPETPAHVKKMAAAVPKFNQPRPIRIARSTIKSVTVPRRSSIVQERRELEGKLNPFEDVGLVSMELSNGRTVDLDITKSPTSALSALDLGVDALKEVKEKMQAYAKQLRSFFTRLKV